jgi:hypothetical protein
VIVLLRSPIRCLLGLPLRDILSHAGTFEFEYVDQRETNRILEASKLIEALSRINPMALSNIDTVRSAMEAYAQSKLASLLGVINVSMQTQLQMHQQWMRQARSAIKTFSLFRAQRFTTKQSLFHSSPKLLVHCGEGHMIGVGRLIQNLVKEDIVCLNCIVCLLKNGVSYKAKCEFKGP